MGLVQKRAVIPQHVLCSRDLAGNLGVDAPDVQIGVRHCAEAGQNGHAPWNLDVDGGIARFSLQRRNGNSNPAVIERLTVRSACDGKGLNFPSSFNADDRSLIE